MPRLFTIAFAFAFALLFAGGAGCGDDNGASDGSAAARDMAVCNPTARTCTAADVCNAPCPADKSGCTDHSCFEPYGCVCQGDHLVCHAGQPFCDNDMAHSDTD
jgi:hypothetical protein